jgi:plastocyanin
MKKRISLVFFSGIVLVSLGLVLAACGSSSGGGSAAVQAVSCGSVSADKTISVTDFAFTPSSVTVAVNNVVKWTSSGAATHTVTSGISGVPDGNFDSGDLTIGRSVCFQFMSAGSFPYFCKYHYATNNMTGTVTVQ